MNYNYETPEEAILSLEEAYRKEDLVAIISSKDFITEAKLMLEQLDDFDENDEEIVNSTAELLKLSLIKSLQENGFPNFKDLRSEFFDLQRFRDNIYVINERIFYPDNSIYETRIFLSFINNTWKVAMIEE